MLVPLDVNDEFTYLTAAAQTDVGCRRKNNEDAFVCLPLQGVFCVADGMGGAQGGEVASHATVEALRDAFTSSPDAPFALTSAASARLIARAIDGASQWIKTRSDARGHLGSGSTAVVLAFDRITPSQALVLHAGDSRAYRLRAGRLCQLSADHSFAAVAGLKDERSLPPRFQGVITRAVGLESFVELEQTASDVQPDDLFLLCSDGLTKMVPDHAIRKLLLHPKGKPLDALAKSLIDAALKAGGEDNVSVLLVRVADTLPQAPTQAIPAETRALEALVSPRRPEQPKPPPPPEPEPLDTSETSDTPALSSPADRAAATIPIFIEGSAGTPFSLMRVFYIFLALLLTAVAGALLFLDKRRAVPQQPAPLMTAPLLESRELTPRNIPPE